MSARPLVCRACGATWLSDAAISLIDAGRTCLRCDAPLFAAESAGESVVRRLFDAVNDADERAVVDALHPDVTVRPAVAGLAGLSPEIHGLEAGLEALRATWSRFTDLRYALGEVVDHGDGRFYCDGGFTARDADGRTHSRPVYWAIRVREQRIVLLAGCNRPQDAWQALGLPRVPVDPRS